MKTLQRFRHLLNQNLRSASQALMAHRLRSILTLSGIAIGIAAIIVIFGLGRAAQTGIRSSIDQFGQNLILLFAVPDVAASSRARFENGQLSLRDISGLRNSFPQITRVAPQISVSTNISYRGVSVTTKGLGVTPEYQEMGKQFSSQGRNLTEADISRSATVAVLSYELAIRFFGSGVALGKRITINNVPFEVVGVQPKSDPGLAQVVEDGILIPITTARKRIGSFNLSTPDGVQLIAISVKEGINLHDISLDIKNYLLKKKGLTENDPMPFSIRSTQEFAQQSEAVLSGIKLSIGAIAAISLFVGILGVANMLYVSVTERASEIGLRMAVGARAADIQLQFITESIFVCGLGNLIGIIIGLIVNLILQQFTGWDTNVTIIQLVLMFLASFGIGLAAGFFPARSASSLSPIDALRRE
jgi:putative ABC transport system permease protein